jgi:beta-glucanase (GH16 family)
MVNPRVDNPSGGPDQPTRRSLRNSRQSSARRLRRARVRVLTASIPTLTVAAVALTGLGATSLTIAARTEPDDAATIAARHRIPATDAPVSHPRRAAPTRTRPAAAPSSPAPTKAPTAAPTASASPSPTVSTTSPAPTASAGTLFTGTPALENWTLGSSSLYRKVTHAGSTAVGGQSDSAATDGKALALTIPAGTGSSPANAAEVDSKASYLYGSFSSRVRTADCANQPATGAVTGIFTYGNDGRDHDGDGIIDNSEIDVEILCARPDILNLTIWTDYDENSDAQQRVSRVIDLKAGRILSTCYLTSFDGSCTELSGAENSPATVPAVAGFDSSTKYHDYRIDWTADRVNFSVADDTGQSVTLWDYQGPTTRIPHTSSAYLVNLWHTDDWTPEGSSSATRSPESALTAFVDSSSVTQP